MGDSVYITDMNDNFYFMVIILFSFCIIPTLIYIVPRSLAYVSPRVVSRLQFSISHLYSFVGDVINRINVRVYVDLDLAPSSSQIRLVHILPGSYHDRIRCKLIPGDWKTSPYEALSYAWGNAVLVRQIELNERLFLVPGNLYSALQSLRYETEERAVWIDALSINQRDKFEREHQVQQMRQIYANASMVLVSLGEAATNIASLFNYIKRRHKGKVPTSSLYSDREPGVDPEYQSLTPSETRATRLAVANLLGHHWWERMWVIQEVAVAKEITVLCGSYSIQWKVFCDFVIQEHLRPEEDDYFGHALLKFLSRGLPELQSHPTLEYGLLDLAHEFRSRQATNPRDKLYALLGLIANEDDRGIVPDYSKPVRDVYMDFVKSHINQYKSVAILSFAEYRGNQYLLPLPSWCPNWTVEALYPAPFWKKSPSDLEMWLHESQDLYYAAGKSKALLFPNRVPGILCLRGFVFDTILAICSVATVPYEGQAKQPEGDNLYNPTRWRRPKNSRVTEETGEGRGNQSGEETYRFTSRRRNRPYQSPRAKTAQWEWEDLALGPWSGRITQYSPYAHGLQRTDAYYQTITAGVSGNRVMDWRFMEHDTFHKNDFPGKGEVCRIINLACMGRRFFITRRGYMGLAPAASQKGDLVSVLLGGNIPFILRNNGQNHRLIGQAYVHGIMAYEDDKMAEDIRNGRTRLQDFLLT